jgi:hypothetical protein
MIKHIPTLIFNFLVLANLVPSNPKKMIDQMILTMTQTTISIPKIFLEQYDISYLENFLATTASIYEEWQREYESRSTPIPVSIMTAVREVAMITTTRTEDFSSITDTSPQEAMFDRIEDLDVSMLYSCAERICGEYVIPVSEPLDEDDSYMQERQVVEDIEKYIAETDNCFYDNFYTQYFAKFLAHMNYKIQ